MPACGGGDFTGWRRQRPWRRRRCPWRRRRHPWRPRPGGEDDAIGAVDSSGQSHTLWVVRLVPAALRVLLPSRLKQRYPSSSRHWLTKQFSEYALRTSRRRPLPAAFFAADGGGDGGGSGYRTTSSLGAAAAFFIFSKTFEAAASSTSAPSAARRARLRRLGAAGRSALEAREAPQRRSAWRTEGRPTRTRTRASCSSAVSARRKRCQQRLPTAPARRGQVTRAAEAASACRCRATAPARPGGAPAAGWTSGSRAASWAPTCPTAPARSFEQQRGRRPARRGSGHGRHESDCTSANARQPRPMASPRRGRPPPPACRAEAGGGRVRRR